MPYAPQGRTPCTIFIKFAEFVPRFSYGGFKLTRSGYPQISAPPSGETASDHQKFLRFKNVLEVLCHRAKYWISPAAGAAKTLSFFCLSVCLFVCLSVTLLNVTDCRPDFTMKALEYRNDFDAVG